MFLYILGYNTQIVKDTWLHLSNYNPLTGVSGIVRVYNSECREVLIREIEIKPSCTEFIFLLGLIGNTYGWVSIQTNQPLLIQVLYYMGESGVVASNLVDEVTEIFSDTGDRLEPIHYFVPFNPLNPSSFVETLFYISNPNPVSVKVKGAFVGQQCQEIEGIELEIEPYCTKLLKSPQGEYGWAWLDAAHPIIINLLLTVTGGLASPKLVASALVLRPRVDKVVPEPDIPCGHSVLVGATHSSFHVVQGEYEDFFQLLIGQGFNVSLFSTGSLDTAALANVNCLIIAVPYDDYTPAEISAIQAYVQSGGGFLLLADHGLPMDAPAGTPQPPWVGPCNQLAAAFGVILENIDIRPSDYVVNAAHMPQHPITQGLANVGTYAVTTMAPGEPLLMTNAQSIPPNRALTVAWTYGRGRVVITGDSNFLRNDKLSDYNNADFGYRAVLWLSHCL